MMEFLDIYGDKGFETHVKEHQNNKKKKMDAYLEAEREEKRNEHEFIRN